MLLAASLGRQVRSRQKQPKDLNGKRKYEIQIPASMGKWELFFLKPSLRAEFRTKCLQHSPNPEDQVGLKTR